MKNKKMASAQSESNVFPSKKTTTTTTIASNNTAMNAVVSITQTTAATTTTTTMGTVSWTLSDFHTSASNWSLHGDAKLLELMESISKNLEKKCISTQTNIDQMMFGIDRTKIRLENTTNTMLSLKNQKFMEARVHDEVEMTTNTSTAGSSGGGVAGVKSNEISPAAPLTTLNAIKIAVDNGIAMMDKCYEKVTINLKDDDDEDGDSGSDVADQSKCIIYRPKNPHYDRPLPYIIGSKEFNEKWHIGLIESEDDDEDEDDDVDDNNDNVENDNLIPPIPCSESSSSYGIGGGHHSSDSASLSVSMTSTNAPAESDTDYSRHSERNPNIFHHSDENLVGKDDHHQQYQPQPSVRKLPTQPIGIVTDLGTNLKKKSDLFDDSDNNDDEDDLFRLPAPKKNINDRVKVLPAGPSHFSGNQQQQQPPPSIFRHQKPMSQQAPVNAFNDEPPELDPNTQLKVERKPVNLFLDSDDDDDLFKSSSTLSKTSTIPIAKPRSTNKTIAVAPNVATKTINLFDDVTDDDDELLFSNSKSQIKNSTLKEMPPNIVNTKPTITNLFDDDDDDDDDDDGPPEDDLFTSMISKPKTITKQAEIVKKSIFDEDEDDDGDLFGAIHSSKSTPSSNIVSRSVEASIAPTTIAISPPTIHANIFDEDSDSGKDQFPPKTTKISIKPTTETKDSSDFKVKQKLNEDIFGGLTKRTNQLKNKNNIFDDDDDEEDDFDSIFANKPKKQLISSNATDATINPIKSSLFDDTLDDDNLFVPQNQKLNNESAVKIPKSIFDDDDDDGELFFSSTNLKPSENSVSSMPPPQLSANIENNYKNPVVPVVVDTNEEKKISMINSLPPSPTTSKKSIKSEQFANFLTKDETNTDSITFVHNRRPFVSFLENDTSGDESDTNHKNNNDVDDDEWKSDSDSVGNLVPPEIEVAAKTAVTNNEQNKSVIKATELIFDDVDKLSPTEIFVENPPEIDVFDTNVEKLPQNIEKPTSQLNDVDDNDLFTKDNSNSPIESISSTKKMITPTNVGLFDDLPPDDFLSTITKTTAQYNSTSKPQSSASIYNDQPPPDDHFENTKIQPIKTDIFSELFDEEDVEDFPIIKSSSPPSKPTLTVKPSLLSSPFDELPPIDDFAISPQTSATLPSSTYTPIEDDVHHKKPSTLSMQIFLDDPPPDDDFLTDLVNPKEKPNSTISKSVYYNDFDEAIPENTDNNDDDVVDKAVSSFKNNLEKFTKPIIDESEIQQPPPKQPPPMRRKISDNLNINVAALLPGAKRPMKATPPLPPPLSVDNDSVISTTNQLPKIIHSNESTSTGSLLIGLNKSRPKLSVSRRPSTRKGRKAEYNKSLLNDNIDSSVVDLSINSDGANLSSQNESIENMFKNATESDLQSPVSTTNTMMDNLFIDYDAVQLNTSSFDDDPMASPSLNSVIVNEDVKTTSTKRLTPIDGEETNRFEEITTTVVTHKDDNNEDNEEDDDDDWLEKSLKSSNTKIISEPPTTTTVKPTTITIKSNNLFSDEDDDDDLFGNTKKPLKVSSSIETETVPSSTIKSNRSITSSSASASTTTKLTKTTPAVVSSKSLFGDDDDDEIDNLFGATKSKKIITTKMTTTTKDKHGIKGKNGVANSLFSDDDDDDADLFSVSKTKVSIQTKIATSKPAGISGGAGTVVNSKSVDQDPLSDLWKQ